ncbi:MAG: alanine racemase [Betaproteobacteria bacterium]|nr:MAG: alanine racemase [Betaproteobacteria bacterium]
MPRPVEAIIDLQALRNNAAVAKRHAGDAKVFAVVKANGYGHGLERILPALGAADGFAVVELELALCIRGCEITKPVLLLEGFFDEKELVTASKNGLHIAVHEAKQIEMLLAARLPQPLSVYLKINTGMNRLGFMPGQVAELHGRLVSSENVREVVAMTHFADADGKRGVDWQLQPLMQLAEPLGTKVCAANSAALLRYPQSHGDWVRPGIMLYGASPFDDVNAEQLGLQPVMTLRSRMIDIQDLQPGDSVGYGCTFTADKAMRIGVVAAGYGDGYPRHAPTGTPALVGGQRVGTIGHVSMDTLCIDISELPDVGVGSEVTLWGEGLPVEQVAASSGTVSYELLTKVTARVPFIVRN